MPAATRSGTAQQAAQAPTAAIPAKPRLFLVMMGDVGLMDAVGRLDQGVTPAWQKNASRHRTVRLRLRPRLPTSMNPERRKAIQQAMLRLADGDRTAMPGLVEQLWPVLLSYAERGLRDPQTAEDVAQEVLFRISSRISELDCTRDPLSWAFGIATFEIMTQRKRRQRRRETPLGEAVTESAEAQSVEDAVMQAEVYAALTEALGQLSPDDVAHLGLLEPAPARPATPAMRKRRQRALDRLRNIWRNIYGQS
jgi:RNA polymerase sigma-70 factor, ECF subfamily